MEQIANKRKALGFTQEDMATVLQISRQAYYRKEKGYVSFNDKEKVIILDMLKELFPEVTIEDLFFSQSTKKYKDIVEV